MLSKEILLQQLEKECSRNIELQWLLKHLKPNYHTIADFRKVHTGPLQAIFNKTTKYLQELEDLDKQENSSPKEL